MQPFVTTSPCIRRSSLLTSLIQALLPSAICPRRLLTSIYSANVFASGYGSFSSTSSSRIGLPFSVVFSGTHPYLVCKRLAICCLDPGLNSSTVTLQNGTPLT